MTFIRQIITRHRTQLEGAGLLHRPGVAKLSPGVAAMRPSPRKAKAALRERPPVSIQPSPFQTLFEISLPAIESTLIDLGEERAEEIVGRLVDHGRQMIDEHGQEGATEHLNTLFGDLSNHQNNLREESGLDRLITTYQKLHFEESAEDYLRLKLGDKIEKMEVNAQGMISLKITSDARLARLFGNRFATPDSETTTGRILGHIRSKKKDLWDGPHLTDLDLFYISKARNKLISLDCGACHHITDEGLAHLKALANLQNLELPDCEEITDAGLAHIGTMYSLLSLDLSEGGLITDEGLVHLSSLPSLQTLSLSLCINITDAGLAHLKALTNLQNLDMQGCEKITDDGLVHIGKISSLLSLQLSSELITDDGLIHLKNLSNLRSLSLQACSITGTGLAHLRGLPSLQTLDLSDSEALTDQGLIHLSALSTLCELHLSETNVADISPLADLSNLRILYLSLTQVSDISPLANLANLQELSLGHTQVTDISPLTNLANLQVLALMGTEVPAAQIEELKVTIPGLEVRK